MITLHTRDAAPAGTGTDRAMREIEERVLWLATAIVDHAIRVRPTPRPGVSGHQASSASMATIETAQWLEQSRMVGHVASVDRSGGTSRAAAALKIAGLQPPRPLPRQLLERHTKGTPHSQIAADQREAP